MVQSGANYFGCHQIGHLLKSNKTQPCLLLLANKSLVYFKNAGIIIDFKHSTVNIEF